MDAAIPGHAVSRDAECGWNTKINPGSDVNNIAGSISALNRTSPVVVKALRERPVGGDCILHIRFGPPLLPTFKLLPTSDAIAHLSIVVVHQDRVHTQYRVGTATMTFTVDPKGRNWGSLVNWDDLGKLYAGIAIAWTVVLYTGAIWLFFNRKMSFLRMRNIPLAIGAISFLHVYLIKILLAYTTNGHFLCSAEFWIMSIYLPFGVALLQANIVQLQSVSEQQQKLLGGEQTNYRRSYRHPAGLKGLFSRWNALTALHKTYALIGLGMLAQVSPFNVLLESADLNKAHRHCCNLWNFWKITRPLASSIDACKRPGILP